MAACAAAEVPDSEGKLVATEGTSVHELREQTPSDDLPRKSSSGNMVVGSSNSCSPSLEEPEVEGECAEDVPGLGGVDYGEWCGEWSGMPKIPNT